MEIRIFSPELAFSGICDRVLSGSASESFADAGRCTLRVPLGEAGRFLREGLLLVPGVRDAYVVEAVRKDGGSGTAEVSGRGVLSLFSRRALSEDVTFSGRAEQLLSLLAQQYGASALPGALSVLECGWETEVNAALGRASLLSAMRSVCVAAGVGMRLDFDADARAFVFRMTERTASAQYLSRSAGNLRRAVRTLDYRNYFNRAIVVGNEGYAVTAEAAGLFSDGVDDASEAVREVYVDGSGLAVSRYASPKAYCEALRAEGKRVLAAHRPQRSVTVETDERTAGALSPGDVCAVSEPRLSLFAHALCTQKTVSFSRGRHSCSVTLAVQETEE